MTTPVIGLDRDGTINVDVGGYVTKPEQFQPIEGSLEAVKMIRDKGYDVVILTNQAGIQKGIMDSVDVDIVHNHMLALLGEIGCKSINGLYYSTTPFKDDPYRKPNAGMFKRASAESISYIIMSQAKIDGVSSREILDKLANVDDAKLSEIITIILNANRYKSSRLGVRQTLTTTETVSRNIID